MFPYYCYRILRFSYQISLSFFLVSDLQFGVITFSPVAALLGLRTFGEVVLKNSLEAPKVRMCTV